jgi:hypothetical protein
MKKLGNELTLILLMTDGTDYTANDLCEHLECTRRNLYYYLQFLRDYGFKVVRNGNCYRLDPHSPFFRRITSSVNFTAAEAALLHQLADGVDARNPAIASVKSKLERFYDLRLFTDARYRKKQMRNLDDLTTAINNQRIVCLHRYSSPHSHSFSDRVVEPFLFLSDHQDVRCYELASGMNKTSSWHALEAWRFTMLLGYIPTNISVFSRICLALLAKNATVSVCAWDSFLTTSCLKNTPFHRHFSCPKTITIGSSKLML